jgi:ribose transport system permease protein
VRKASREGEEEHVAKLRPEPMARHAGSSGFLRGERLQDFRDRLGSQSIVYAIFIAVIIVFAIKAPSFATLASLTNIGRQAAAVVVVSVGMTIIIVCAEIDLSVGSTVSLAGLIGALLMSKGWAWPVAVLATLGLGAAIGAVNGFLTGYIGVPSFLVTLGGLEAIGALAQMVTNTLAVPVVNTGFMAVLGPGSFLQIPLAVWWGLAVVLAGAYLLHVSVFGRWVYATGGNRNAARYSGISYRNVVLMAFVLSGVCAAFAGLLLTGRSGAGDPNVGSDMELSAIAAVILGGTDLFGGRGTILGTVIGALFIAVIGVGLILLGAGAQLQALVTGAIIVVAVTINKLGQRR